MFNFRGCPVYPLWSDLENVFGRNCKRIENKLNELDEMTCKVSRHTIFDIKVYVIETKGDVHVEEIAEKLDIPEEWVTFADINIDKEPTEKVFYLKEDEFNDKYANKEGKLWLETLYEACENLNAHRIKSYFSELLNIPTTNVFCHFCGIGMVEICLHNINDKNLIKCGTFSPKYDDYIVFIKPENLKRLDSNMEEKEDCS